MASGHEQLRPIGAERMEYLREVATSVDDETLAVVVLSGSKERGLAMSVSSELEEDETWGLLTHLVLTEADEKGWVSVDGG